MTSTLQHFGYWPGSHDASSSIEEQRGHANVTKVITVGWNHNGGGWGDPAGAFARARAAGQKALLDIPFGADRPRFAEWAAVIRPFWDAGDILAFFILDEPDCVSGGNTPRLQELLMQIAIDCQEVNTHFPGARCMMTLGCFNAAVPGMGFRIPAGITDIGIEAYYGQAMMREWLDRLATYLLPSHRLWLLPYVHASGMAGAPPHPLSEADQASEARLIYEFAKASTRVVGLLPFTWYGGARERPALQGALATIGREIVTGTIGPIVPIVPIVDRTPRLDQIVPAEVIAGRPFTLALLGDHFDPRAVAQYSAWGAPYVDFPALVLHARTILVGGPPVPPGTYNLRVKNPDGVVTGAQAVHMVACR